MPGWGWLLIWLGLGVSGLGYLGYLLLELAGKAKRAAAVIEPLAEQAKELSTQLEKLAER